MAVSREWQAAVLRMKPLQSIIKWMKADALVAGLCASRLRRHVSRLLKLGPLSVARLNILAERMPHLLELEVHVALGPRTLLPPPLTFPTALRRLSIQLSQKKQSVLNENEEGAVLDESAQAAYFNAMLDNIALLPALEELCLNDSFCSGPFISLDALPRMLSLRKLDIMQLRMNNIMGKSKPLAQLRSLTQLESLSMEGEYSLSELLAPGHRLRLLELSSGASVTQQDSDALASLPSLTTFSLRDSDFETLDFLRALPLLTSFKFSFDDDFWDFSFLVDADLALSALQTCSQMTRLDLGLQPDVCQLSSEQWGELLPRMPLLQDLRISGATQMTSLSFLTRGPITRTLTSLRLSFFKPRVRLEELVCVHALRSLQSLRLERVFDLAMDPVHAGLYYSPSLLFPSLRDSSIRQ